MKFLSWLFGSSKPKEASVDNNIVVAEVLAFAKHPNADRLRVVTLSISDRTIDPVVCGAANFNVGDRVVLALPGAKIAQNIHSDVHEPFILGKAKIRGVESQGMICSGFELGLRDKPEDKPEILILKPTARPGSLFTPDLIQ